MAEAQSESPKVQHVPSEILTRRLESPPKSPSVQAQIYEEPPAEQDILERNPFNSGSVGYGDDGEPFYFH